MCATPACHRIKMMHLALCFQHLVSRVVSDAKRRGKPYKNVIEAARMQTQRLHTAAKCRSCGLTNEQLHVRRQRAPWSLPYALQADNSKYLQVAHIGAGENSTTMHNTFLLCALCNKLQGAHPMTYEVLESVRRRALGEWTRQGNAPGELTWMTQHFAGVSA